MTCKLTYRQLLTMLERANRNAEMCWKEEIWDYYIRYAKIGARIVKAMEKYKTNEFKLN